MLNNQLAIGFIKKPTLDQRREFNKYKFKAFDSPESFQLWLFENFRAISILDPTLTEDEVLKATELIKNKSTE